MLSQIAIVGFLFTENLGIERMIRNIVTNPAIRYLILCGRDSRGHQAGQAILSLKENGVDENHRIIGAKGPRAVLKNISRDEIEAFRKNSEVLDDIDCMDVERIAEVLKRHRENAPGTPVILPPNSIQKPKIVEARKIKEWTQDPEGFFYILTDKKLGGIICEHYRTDGVINEVIRGASAEDIANTAIQRGLVSRLDHAAYLGRELAKVEDSLRVGLGYRQDESLRTNPKNS